MNVLVLGKIKGGVGEHMLNLKKHSKNNLTTLSYDNGIPVIPIPVLRAISFIVIGFFYGLYVIYKKKIEVIHAHFIVPPGLLAFFLSFFTWKPYVITIHGSDSYSLKTLNPLKNFILKRAKSVICVSNSLKKQIGFGRVVYNGTDVKKTKKIELKRPAVLFVGALTKNKAGMLNEIIEKTNANFYVIGEGPIKIKNAFLLGQLPKEQVYAYYNSADLLVSCSEWEGFSLSILEAQAHGLPVVARPNTAQKELNQGLFADSPGEFSKQIYRLLKDNRLKRKIIKASKSFARKYTWVKTARETDMVYKNARRD